MSQPLASAQFTVIPQRALRIFRNGMTRLRQARESRDLSGAFTSGAAHLPGASAYAHLHPTSLAVCGVLGDDSQPRSLNIVLPELTPSGIFAGIRTALEFACELAGKTKLPLRIITLRGASSPQQRRVIVAYLHKEFATSLDASIHESRELPGFKVNSTDLWIATHWTTAHALDVAKRLTVVNPAQVIYLIQDYEPSFNAWSTDFALARATYHAGFHHVVNSSPLQHYLRDFEGLRIDRSRVFAPSVDLARLALAAQARRPSPTPRIFFYARPSKPRNLYAIGISALHLVAEELAAQGLDASFVSAGEPHGDVRLSARHVLLSKGKLAWDDYFQTLGESDVVLSLQHSPHPSHPPLDAVSCGGIAVTNEMGGTRTGLHPRLLVAEPDPRALADQVLKAIEMTRSASQVPAFDSRFAARFGDPLADVVARLLPSLGL
jgi:hypothetical protein